VNLLGHSFSSTGRHAHVQVHLLTRGDQVVAAGPMQTVEYAQALGIERHQARSDLKRLADGQLRPVRGVRFHGVVHADTLAIILVDAGSTA
jgi:hypothetical protein